MKEPPTADAARQASAAPFCLLVADDLTGAADACARFVTHGYSGTVVIGVDATPSEADLEGSDVIAVNADTRRHTPDDAGARVRRSGRFALPSPDAVVFKKIDSSLRGHIGVELLAALETFERTHAIVAPSFPAMGRIVRDGWLSVEGPGASPPCEVRALLANQGVVGCKTIGAPATGDAAGTASVLLSIGSARDAGARVLVFDAGSDADLRAIVDAGLQAGGRPLWVGSAGLAGALASQLAPVDRRPSIASDGPVDPTPQRPDRRQQRVLLFIGSPHPVSCAQRTCLASARRVAVVRPDDRRPSVSDRLRIAQHLLIDIHSPAEPGWLVSIAEAVPRDELGGFVLSGGDTAADACAALGAIAIRLGGELSDGIPWGVLAGGRWHGLPVVLKSGAFGGADALVRAADFLSSRTR